MASISGDYSTNLVSFWELEETSGTRVDSHGSNDLTDNNTVGYATGKQGNCADLERGNNEYLSITDAAQSGLDITGDMTILGWFQFETDPNEVTHGLVCKFSTSGNYQYLFALQEQGSSNYLRFGNSANGTTYVEKAVSTFNPAAGTWYQLGVVYEAAAGTVKFYVNGAQTGATQTGAPTSTANTAAPFTIGNDGNAGSAHDGLIDEVGIWSRALSAAEIDAIYNAGDGIPYAAASSAVTVSATVVTATLSIPAYTVTAVRNVVVTPSTATATLSAVAPTVSADANVTVGTQVLTSSIPAYTIIADGNIVVTVGTKTLVASIPAYTVTTQSTITVTPNTQVVTVGVIAPTVPVGTGVVVSPSTPSVVASIPSATVIASRSIGVVVSPITLSAVTVARFRVGGVWTRSPRATAGGDWTRSAKNYN